MVDFLAAGCIHLSQTLTSASVTRDQPITEVLDSDVELPTTFVLRTCETDLDIVEPNCVQLDSDLHAQYEAFSGGWLDACFQEAQE